MRQFVACKFATNWIQKILTVKLLFERHCNWLWTPVGLSVLLLMHCEPGEIYSLVSSTRQNSQFIAENTEHPG